MNTAWTIHNNPWSITHEAFVGDLHLIVRKPAEGFCSVAGVSCIQIRDRATGYLHHSKRIPDSAPLPGLKAELEAEAAEMAAADKS